MIGIIAAMPSEAAAITDKMERVSRRTVAKKEFAHGWLGGKEAVVALSGVGKTAAAITATLMSQLYQPECIINVGVAGGLCQDQQVGDLVISDALVQADYDTSAIDGEQGRGLRFEADKTLAKLAKQAAGQLGIPYKTGLVATQDLFMADKKDLEKLLKYFPDSVCSEMEGGAIAQAAKTFGIPFLALRSLSDVAVHDDNPTEFSVFEKESAKAAALLLEKLAGQMPA